MTTTKKEAPVKETSLIPKVAENSLQVKDFNPQRDIENAKIAAKALMSVVEQKPKKVMFNGKQYLEFADWQTIAKFFNITTGTEWTRPIVVNGKQMGWEARAVAYQNGQIIGGAEAACMRDEGNWKSKAEFQLRSMAQTRAHSKTLRSILGYIAVLAGMADTPAEEMTPDVIAITDKQTKMIKDLMEQKGISHLEDIGIAKPQFVSKEWASETISELLAYEAKSDLEKETILTEEQLREI